MSQFLRDFLPTLTNEVYCQGIIPLSHRGLVLKYSHDIKASGHLVIKKTLSKIRQSYYWPGLQNDGKTYVGGCDICARRKEPLKTKRAPREIVKSGYPIQRIAIDISGELPITERGNRYILVIGDSFSKWTECHAMPNMEASTVAIILIEQDVSRFGIPYYIHSDQGRQFESKLFSEMCKLPQNTKTAIYNFKHVTFNFHIFYQTVVVKYHLLDNLRENQILINHK